MKKLKKTLSGMSIVTGSALVLAVLTVQAQGAPIVVQPINAQTHGGWGTDREPANAIDGSGLYNNGLVDTGDPIPVLWPDHDTNNNNSLWSGGSFSSNDTTIDNDAWFMVDLGQNYKLDGWRHWSGGRDIDRDINLVQMAVAPESASGGWDANDVTHSDWTLENQTRNIDHYAEWNTVDNGFTYSFDGTNLDGVEARYVMFNIGNNHGDIGVPGIGEIRFFTIPEPSSLLLLGLGSLLLMKRRRRRA